jgi:ABC-type transport system involved in multi-copper enzyme maturation permease subunit
LLIAAVFALVGINDRGFTVAFYTFEHSTFNTQLITPRAFYSTLFVNFGVNFWLSWLCVILGIVSTAGIFPDLVASGSIDLILSKPLGRVRLFVTKYVLGLLFVFLQVTAFTTACFLVIGLRGSAWLPQLFLAVPIVTAFFSFLFCVTVLTGILSRSTIASIIVTLLVWFVLFIGGTADAALGSFAVQSERRAAALEKDVEVRTAELEALKSGAATGGLANALETRFLVIPQREAQLKARQESLPARRETAANFRTWQRRVTLGRALFPKTAETTGLLEAALDTGGPFGLNQNPPEVSLPPVNANQQLMTREQMIQRRRSEQREQEFAARSAKGELNTRSLWWTLGTSFAFQFVVAGFACWRFSRRDF